MILINATIKYKGYDPNTLAPKSHKRICVSCDLCGKVRWISNSQLNKNICHSCSIVNNDKFGGSGDGYGFSNKKHTQESKDKMSESQNGKIRSDEQKLNYSKSKMGEKNPQYGLTDELSPNYGIKHSNDHNIKMSCSRRGIDIKDFDGFIGKHSKRSYVLSEEKCIKLNNKFKGSHFHHITKSLGIYVPGKLHNHIKHDIRKGENMGEMNLLSLQFINGGL